MRTSLSQPRSYFLYQTGTTHGPRTLLSDWTKVISGELLPVRTHCRCKGINLVFREEFGMVHSRDEDNRSLSNRSGSSSIASPLSWGKILVHWRNPCGRNFPRVVPGRRGVDTWTGSPQTPSQSSGTGASAPNSF